MTLIVAVFLCLFTFCTCKSLVSPATTTLIAADGGSVVPESNAFGPIFRNYDQASDEKAFLEDLHKKNRNYQTYEFATKKKEEYEKLDKAVMGIWKACELLGEYVNIDPALGEHAQLQHLLQSAEAIRRDYPNEEWLHLTALIHDIGKVLLTKAFGEQPQWSIVPSTFPVGCAFDKNIVYYKFFEENPDYSNPAFNTTLGVYTKNCGLDKVTMSWGHDEYMYLVTKGNKNTLPPATLYIIRFHSFHAWQHHGAYTYLMNDEDKAMLKWVQLFNKYDIYDKNVVINVEEVKPYYLSLINKYFPGDLKW